MKNSNFKSRDIEIKNLSLWDENARFPDKYFNKPEEELISYFLAKKNFKIKELAEAIVKDFDLPQIEKVIIYEYGGRLIVLEGNRRLIAYKLLSNPNLTSDSSLKDFFNRLKGRIDIDDNLLLECLVTENIEQGLRYIDRKHANGNYEIGWGDTERAHYNARRGNAKKNELFKIAIAKIIKELDIPEEMKEEVLGHGNVTNFYRIIESSPAWDLFGFELEDNGNLRIKDKDFNEKLKVIILNVLQKKDLDGKPIDSRSLNKNLEKEQYLKSIQVDDFKKVEKEIEQSKVKNIFGEESVVIGKNDGKRSNPKSTLRSYLIPKTCTFSINIAEPKINNSYCELKNDLLLDDSRKAVPNAVGVLFRVFLEISIDYFLEKEGEAINPETKLAGKITKIADYMEQKGIATTKQLGNIRKVAIAKTSILSIDNFHDYVHSYKSQPSSSDLKLKWDNLQEFFELLWGHLDKKNFAKINKNGNKK